MANHGYCKNCWWWKQRTNVGVCWFVSNYPSHIHKTSPDSYCPDYLSRKSEEKRGVYLLEFLEKEVFHYRR